MDIDIVTQLFVKSKLDRVNTVEKINIGYTNEVYVINDKYILKVCKDVNNEINFKKEIFFYTLFRSKFPVPQVLVFDKSKHIYNRFFTIYKKIKGVNLYSLWHLLTNDQRKNFIKQLCQILRVITEFSIDEYVKHFKEDPHIDWVTRVTSNIGNSLSQIEKAQTLKPEFNLAIKNYVNVNKSALVKQTISLVYWDAHFDNIIVNSNTIAGILDFERTDLSSIDYNLDVIKRMVDYPTKYMSEEYEKFAKKEDYVHLLTWFREFYPELFAFDNLDIRLNLYALEHDLATLVDYPKSKETKDMIAKVIKYNFRV